MKYNACFKLFGKYINFYIGKEEKIGRLVKISIDSTEKMLVGIDENGFIEEYELREIQVIKNNDNQKELIKAIIKQVNKDINSFKYDLVEYHKKELVEILQKIPDEEIRNTVIDCFSIDTLFSSYKQIDKIIRKQTITQEEADLLYGLVAYRQHNSDVAYKIFSYRWLSDKNDADKCRDFILVADEFDNDVLCFFLLKYFFEQNGRYLNDKYYTNLWWKYLYYAVKYNNFDFLENVKITEWNVRILIDSFVYVFHMYHLEHLSSGLVNQFINGNNTILQRNNEDLRNIEEAIDELNLYKNYLPDTAEGYYLRFEFCLKKIITSYSSDNPDIIEEDKAGYIYEYVKSRNYGFIIGYDFQKYFYHWDYLSPNLKKES